MKRFSGANPSIAKKPRKARMKARMTTPHPTRLIERLPKVFCSHAPARKLIAAPSNGSNTINLMNVTFIGWSIA